METEIINSKNVFIPTLGIAKMDTFSTMYPLINNYLMQQKTAESRAGEVREVLDFKTHITNPYRRCVGGYKRNINVFFLLAEAMWIACGRKDVHFLTIFNSNMAEFSDDGETFHAPYGYRMRHWGVKAEDEFVGGPQGYDQVIDALRLFTENPNTRQVVLSIWNPSFDLGYKTKDIPCNDIVMLKIREGKLITTIANRSNDLHLGLPTNLFQFSFLTELMAAALGIELGTQTHNSQSLHVYSWNKTAETMNQEWNEKHCNDLYADCGASEVRMDFNFSHEVPVNRFREIECVMNLIIENILRIERGEDAVEDEIKQIAAFSHYLYAVYQLLRIYVLYKQKMAVIKNACNAEKDNERLAAFAAVVDVENEFISYVATFSVKVNEFRWDISVLAKNWFAARMSEYRQEVLGNL